MGVSRRLVEREHFGIAGTLPASFSKNTPFASPPHQSKVLGRVGYGGGRTLLQKGFPPPLFPKEKLMFDCIVVGAGHAGCEAAMTLARFGQTSTQFWQTVSQLRQRSPSQQALPGARRMPLRAIASASVGWASAGMS